MTVVLKNISDPNYLIFEKPRVSDRLNQILEVCKEKNNGYVCLTIDRPHKPRTTGEDSQNNLFWKLCSIIANEVGDDSRGMSDTENAIKEKAIGKGYPYHVSKLTGKMIPESMTKIDTVQCSYLIDTEYQIIAELGIILPPNIENDGETERTKTAGIE